MRFTRCFRTPLRDRVPLSMPKNAAAASEIADQMVRAYRQSHSGVLDLG